MIATMILSIQRYVNTMMMMIIIIFYLFYCCLYYLTMKNSGNKLQFQIHIHISPASDWVLVWIDNVLWTVFHCASIKYSTIELPSNNCSKSFHWILENTPGDSQPQSFTVFGYGLWHKTSNLYCITYPWWGFEIGG